MHAERDPYTGTERKQAEKFDRVVTDIYDGAEDLVVEPIHWTKFDTKIPTYHHPYPHLVRSLGELTGKRVLEIGCGTGILSVILAKLGAQHVEAFDISEKSVEIAQRRAKANGVADRTRFQAMSVYEMDYGENVFDYIVGLNILHHINIEDVVEKLHLHLKPGGSAHFLEPFGNALWLEKLRLLVPVKVREEDKTHYDEKLKYQDVEIFRRRFDKVDWLEFHLFSRLDRVVKSKAVLNALGRLDEWLLASFPFLRKYSRKIVVELTK